MDIGEIHISLVVVGALIVIIVDLFKR